MNGCPLKSAMADKLSPLAIPASPALVGPGSADTQRDTPGTADRKLTRNLKRRYDEIHNVPKVCATCVRGVSSGFYYGLIKEHCSGVQAYPSSLGRFVYLENAFMDFVSNI
jgi:hypothetical protein